MASITDNSFFLLRVMIEHDFVSNKYTTKNQLRELSGLEGIAYDQAENYLIDKSLIIRHSLGSQGKRCVTSLGVDYVEQEMQSRIRLSLNAERALKYIIEVEPDRNNFGEVDQVQIDQMESELKLQRDEVVDALRELEDEGLVEAPFDGTSATIWGAFSTAEGRKVLKRNFRLPQQPAAQIGAIYNAPVTANNLVNAINSQIEQTFNQNEPDAIRQTIDATLTGLVDKISLQLTLSQHIAYLQIVAELKAELEKPEPNPSIIQRLVSAIGFADTLNGTLDLGIKAFGVAAIAAPYVPVLFEQIKNLFRALGVAV